MATITAEGVEIHGLFYCPCCEHESHKSKTIKKYFSFSDEDITPDLEDEDPMEFWDLVIPNIYKAFRGETEGYMIETASLIDGKMFWGKEEKDLQNEKFMQKNADPLPGIDLSALERKGK